MTSAEIVTADIEGSGLPSLAKRIKEEHRLAEFAAGQLLTHAINAGEALIAAKAQVEDGKWLEWLALNVEEVKESAAQIYMRIARHQQKLPSHIVGITEARAYLRGLPAAGANQGYPQEIRDEAKRLVGEGMPAKRVARVLGVSDASVRNWTDPEYAKKLDRSKRADRKRRREAMRALREAKKAETRRDAAKSAGGAVHDAYSRLRLAIESLDAASREAQDREAKLALGDALGYAYKAEDKIAEALKSS